MAAPTQRSSNNLCSSHLQSKPRSSEAGNTMRRSFSGNPFTKPSIIVMQRGAFNPSTPPNTPSDYPRRRSVGRENIVVSLLDENKENGRDQNLKPSKLRSPVSSKGTKHFMSPTFSAASKVNASPRKKVLGERDEPIRTSISSFEGKNSLIEDCDSKTEKGSSQKKEVSFDTTVTYMGQNDAAEVDHEELDAKIVNSSAENYSDMLSSGTKYMEKDFVNLDPSFEISPRVPCSVPCSSLAPLDADPSMPPYDPKTNYLSPRPQFLHYRPNPRIELYLNRENEGKRLDESFTSESNSDTDVTEEESQSENSQNDAERSSSNVALAEEEKVDVEEENEFPVTETTSISTVEVKKVSKPQFFTRTKFTFFLLLVASAFLCVSLNNSPIMEANVLNNLSFSEPYIPPEFVKLARNTFNNITFKLQRSLYDSLSCILDLVSSFTDRHKIGALQHSNLTNLLEESLVNSGNNIFGQTRHAEVINEVVDEHEEDKLQYYPEVLEDQSVEDTLENDAIKEDVTIKSDETLQSSEDSIDEDVQVENSVQEDVEARNLKISDESEFTEHDELKMGSTEVLFDIIDLSIPEDGHGDIIVDQNDANAEASQILEKAVENPKISESTEPVSDNVSEISSEQSTSKVSMLILSMLAATALAYVLNQRHPTKNAALTVEQNQQKEWQTEVDMAEESCPSEMSSYQKSSAYTNNDLTRTVEAQSQERRPSKNYRRESLASSDYSTGSPSYGSFTTYEKIPTKHGYAEEEVVTPVRRSSRIRNLVTSP